MLTFSRRISFPQTRERQVRKAVAVLILVTAGGWAATSAQSPPTPGSRGVEGDLAAARAVFEKNLDAIRRRDKAAYISCYLESDKLARTGADGIALGYAGLVKSAGENWPDTFDASDLDL
jgi:hypothetical protein